MVHKVMKTVTAAPAAGARQATSFGAGGVSLKYPCRNSAPAAISPDTTTHSSRRIRISENTKHPGGWSCDFRFWIVHFTTSPAKRHKSKIATRVALAAGGVVVILPPPRHGPPVVRGSIESCSTRRGDHGDDLVPARLCSDGGN